MKTAKELKDKYDENLKELQSKCKHKKTTWCEEWFAPAHGTGWEVECCNTCGKIIRRKGSCYNCCKKILVLEDYYNSLDYFHPLKHHLCSKLCQEKYNPLISGE